MAPRRGGIPERWGRILLAASLMILFLGVAQVAAPALTRAPPPSIVAPPTRPSPPSVTVPPPTSTTAPATTTAPPRAVVPSVLVMPAIHPTSPGGYGCDAAMAYLLANQAPGFADVCAPKAAGPGRAGFTVADTVGTVTTGTIYISCPAPIVYQNEASNSWKFSGVAGVPLDPWGGVPVSQCRAGDIAPG